MYSYGSSARVGVDGKRGHGGGRPYRPPRKRKDPNSTPPSMKECNCLIEIDIPEYLTRCSEGSSRQHVCFINGRVGMEYCLKVMRHDFQVHLIIPGRKQAGPVAIVAATYRQGIPAIAYFLHSLVGTNNKRIQGRIHLNVKASNSQQLSGTFGASTPPPPPPPSPQESSETTTETATSAVGPSTNGLPYWLFQSSSWSVIGCSLRSRDKDKSDNNDEPPNEDSDKDKEDDEDNNDHDMMTMTSLKTCLDNIVFRLGQTSIGQLDIFTDSDLYHAFAAGNPDRANVLYQEIQQSFTTTTTTTNIASSSSSSSNK